MAPECQDVDTGHNARPGKMPDLASTQFYGSLLGIGQNARLALDMMPDCQKFNSAESAGYTRPGHGTANAIHTGRETRQWQVVSGAVVNATSRDAAYAVVVNSASGARRASHEQARIQNVPQGRQ